MPRQAPQGSLAPRLLVAILLFAMHTTAVLSRSVTLVPRWPKNIEVIPGCRLLAMVLCLMTEVSPTILQLSTATLQWLVTRVLLSVKLSDVMLVPHRLSTV